MFNSFKRPFSICIVEPSNSLNIRYQNRINNINWRNERKGKEKKRIEMKRIWNNNTLNTETLNSEISHCMRALCTQHMLYIVYRHTKACVRLFGLNKKRRKESHSAHVLTRYVFGNYSNTWHFCKTCFSVSNRSFLPATRFAFEPSN